MERFKAFVHTVFIGGVTVLLPIVILIFLFSVILKFVVGLIHPLTQLLEAHFNIAGVEADAVVVILILSVAFLVGLLVQTKFGRKVHVYIERQYLENTPGYKIIKDTTTSLISGKQSPLAKVALVKVFDSDTLMTSFITHEHKDGTFTVFVPMSPPTSGFVFHLKPSQVFPIDVSTEEAMKTMLGLGTGSGKLMEKFFETSHSSRKSV